MFDVTLFASRSSTSTSSRCNLNTNLPTNRQSYQKVAAILPMFCSELRAGPLTITIPVVPMSQIVILLLGMMDDALGLQWNSRLQSKGTRQYSL